MKEFLSHAGVEFTAYNVDEDERAYDALVARRFRTVPVTIAGEHVVHGFDVPALEALVAAVKDSGEPRAQ